LTHDIFDKVVWMTLFAFVSFLLSTIDRRTLLEELLFSARSKGCSMTTNSIGPSSRGLNDLLTKRRKEAEPVIDGTIKIDSRNHELWGARMSL
jgi:hypothetical protein